MNDTIVACATPTGYSSIAVIRVSGDSAVSLLKKVFVSEQNISEIHSGRIYYGKIVSPINFETIDYVLVSIFLAPNSYTGEDVVEISCHGNPLIVDQIIKILIDLGARIAQPGEFTKRAFLNNKIDLVQAEAVLDTIYAECNLARKVAIYQLEGKFSAFLEKLKERLIIILTRLEASIDFPEEEDVNIDLNGIRREIDEMRKDIERLLENAEQGLRLKQGFCVVIVGRQNVGKSTLFNCLLGYDRAIVHETPGTTRDFIEEEIELEGVLVRLVDTAGMFTEADGADRIAIKRTEELLNNSDLILLVFDGAEPMNEQDTYIFNLTKNFDKIFIVNKIDLNLALKESSILSDAIKISAKNGDNIDLLKKTIKEHLIPQSLKEDSLILRRRHIEALNGLYQSLLNMKENQTPEIIAFELHNALDIIGEITGKVLREEILNKIFEEFCIGK